MTSTLLNRLTATKENALTEAEREAFLTDLRIGHLATMREDGWPHVTPIWYIWDDGASCSRSARAAATSGTSPATRR